MPFFEGGAFSYLAFNNDAFFVGFDKLFDIDRVLIARQQRQPGPMTARLGEQPREMAATAVQIIAAVVRPSTA